MQFKTHRAGQLWGLFQILIWMFLIPWIIIVLPLDLYYSNPTIETPAALERVYDVPFFDWRITAVIITGFLVFLIGGFMVWVGWYEMHPIKIRLSEEKKKPVDRLKIVNNFSKEKF